MSTIERSIDLEVPASTAYDAWTRFERFPEFMDSVEQVQQRDDRHLHWRAGVFGRTKAWDAEIVEQIPDKRIAWRSEAGTLNAGVVTFHRLSDDASRVMLQMEFVPRDWSEKIGNALGFMDYQVRRDLASFKQFVEKGASPS